MVRLSLRLGDHIPMFGRFKQGAITMRMAIGRRAMTTRAPANQIKMTDVGPGLLCKILNLRCIHFK